METAFPRPWQMDGFETFLEGSARYVEAKFLITPSKRSFERLNHEPTFQKFTASAGKRPSELPGLGNLGSKYFYSLGMSLCVLLDVADPKWKTKLFEDDRPLLAQVERAAR